MRAEVLRHGFTPLFTRFEDVWISVETIAAAMAENAWAAPEHRVRAAVT